MGRLRNDYESPLIRSMTQEIVDLYGIDDAFLFRWSSADNITNKDSLYSEPMTTPQYKKYRIKAHRLDPENKQAGDPEGRDLTSEATLFVALNHLLGAQIPQDDFGDYVTGGDTIGLYSKGAYIEYDITNSTRTGWVNDSDSFAGYILTCIRREKFVPERKTT